MVGAMTTRFVLITETNSLFDYEFLRRLLADERSVLSAVITRTPGVLCAYYLDDDVQVDVASDARANGVDVYQPEDPNAPEIVEAMRTLAPDYIIVANYQLQVGRALRDVPTVDIINFHPSPLPRYAGLAPYFWMAKNHETQGGVSAIRMSAGLDDGPLIAQQLLSLRGDETADEIRSSHFEASWRLFELVLPTLHDRSYRSWPQDLSLRTYYGAPPQRVLATA